MPVGRYGNAGGMADTIARMPGAKMTGREVRVGRDREIDPIHWRQSGPMTRNEP